MTPSIPINEAIEMFKRRTGESKIHPEDVSYYSWPETFASTCGPFHGIGGQIMTRFQVEAYEYNGHIIYFCGGKVFKTTTGRLGIVKQEDE